MSEVFDFDSLEPVSIAVRYGGERFVLVDPSGEAAFRYRNAVVKATRFGPDGKPVGMDGAAEADAVLLAGCLFRADAEGKVVKNGQGIPVAVHESVIKKWPNKVIAPLVARAKQIGGLEGNVEDPAKNLPNGTTAGSVSPATSECPSDGA